MSSPSQDNTGEEELSDLDVEILAMFSPEQPNTGEENDPNIDPEILAMLEEANQAFKEGLEEQEAYNRELQEDLDFDATLDQEFEQAFAILDEEDPGWDDPTWSDHSGANSVESVRSYGFGSLPDEYRNNDDDARSEGSDLSLFREKIPPVGSRPILKPKTRVRATPAEKAASAMMPFTVSNPATIPAMFFPSNPTWGGAPIPSSSQQTLTFMGATTSVPVLSDTANMELVNNMGVTNTPSSNSKDNELVDMAMQELNTARHEIAAAGVHRAALEADIRRLEEDRKDMGLRVADLEKRLSEKLDSAARAQQAVTNELQICRNALAASQQSCNAMNKENGDLRRKISDLDNATSNLDKEGNEIRHRVSELTNQIAFVNRELDSRTRERDFAVQKLGEAQFNIDQMVAANSNHLQQIATMESNAAAKDIDLKNFQSIAKARNREVQNLQSIAEAKDREVQNLQSIAEAKNREVQNLQSIAEAKDLEAQNLKNIAEAKDREVQNLTSIAEAKELEVKNFMMALTKSETEKQHLELKSKEKEDILEGDGGEPEKALSKTEQSWRDKYDAAEKNLAAAERHAEAYEQDYYDMKKQCNVAHTTVSRLTDTIAKMKVVAQEKEAMISELTLKGTEFSKDFEKLKFSTDTERKNYYIEMDKLKKSYTSIKGENEYIDDLLSKVNLECTSLNGLATRNKRKIQELEEALENEAATIASLQEQVKKERNSSDDALHVSRIAALHRVQRTHGFPRPPRDNGRPRIPTLEEQLAAWREDDGRWKWKRKMEGRLMM
ncbi:hypothetical protein V491_04911 [Pseudogymnoascus sp. VKM F-3775]|nr:hypothetical protein V491_04911 [Pseudogymnoascus sp. VKM F-3775]